MGKSTRKRKPNRIVKLEFRVEQLELALMNLMFVIANQDDELPRFIDSIKKAENHRTAVETKRLEEQEMLESLPNQDLEFRSYY